MVVYVNSATWQGIYHAPYMISILSQLVEQQDRKLAKRRFLAIG